ncbi:MAG: MBL fold metallo-hydrolase [Firmicutes bacterium]|nr:MBL fold metallo-hydrolase [Bacillota bacterium]
MISFATLFSSSKGNSVFVSDGKTKILVDAGMAACHIENALSQIGESIKDIAALMITHEHQDHIKSAGSLSRRYDIPIYATPKLWETFHGFGNISERNQRKYDYGMTIGNLTFDFFKTFHDAVQPVGIVITEGDLKLGICTDTGIVSPRMIEMLKNADGLVFESNHDPVMLKNSRYAPALKARISGGCGHLSNEAAVEALKKIIGPATKEILLAHLSEENNRPEIAYQKAFDGLRDYGVGETIRLSVAPPDRTSNIIKLG